MIGARKSVKFDSKELSKIDRHLLYLWNNGFHYTVSAAKDAIIIVWWDSTKSS